MAFHVRRFTYGVYVRHFAYGRKEPAAAARRSAPAGQYAGGVSGLNLRRDPYRPDPWPAPPGQPSTPGGADRISPWLEERLFDRRIVIMRGRLEGAVASQVAGALLALDAVGPEPVELHLSAQDGGLGAPVAGVDRTGAVRAPVHVVGTSEIGGAALAVLAAANRRLALRHAHIRLAEPRVATVAGTADEVTAAAGQYLRELEEM